jgi:hypothetical protein
MRSIIVDSNLYAHEPDKFEGLHKLSSDTLSNLSEYYPGFGQWYAHKVVPGLKTGERKILLRYIDNRIAGIAILKSTSEEKKLCCLRVLPDFQGSGVGIRLFAESFKHLETEQPLLSVAEEQFSRFERIFRYFSFEVGNRYEDLYRKKKFETSYNGLLDVQTDIKR